MSADLDQRLRAMAEVIVRVGLNLQPNQPLLITDPYDLQGIHPDARSLAEAVRAQHRAETEIIIATPDRLRDIVAADDTRAYDALVAGHVSRLERHLAAGGAFLFLPGGDPRLHTGVPAAHLAQFDRIKWNHLGRLIQQLIRGATQWTLAPAPTGAWADAAFADLPSSERLPALWNIVFAALFVDASLPITASGESAAVAAWRGHLAALALRRDGLNAAHHRQVHYTGPGTDLTFALSRTHVWCTVQLMSRHGIPFVANLPTEEVFTAPHRDSAHGRLRMSRAVAHAGTVIENLELEVVGGRVVTAQATTGQELLRELLATDDGAARFGEVAIVPRRNALALAGRCFHHILLDENAASHVALGDAYRFCSRAWLPLALNSSQLHLDLPLHAAVTLA